MTDPILAQLAALKGAPAPALKAKWRALFDTLQKRREFITVKRFAVVEEQAAQCGRRIGQFCKRRTASDVQRVKHVRQLGITA